MTNQPKTVPIPMEVLEGIFHYLTTKPFSEVHKHIALLNQCAEHAQQVDDAPLSEAEQRAVNDVLADKE